MRDDDTLPSVRSFVSTGGTEEEGASILDEVRAFVHRFVAFPSDAALTAVVLWVAHTHAVEHFYTSPRLTMLSPEPQSGKTRVLEVLDVLVATPMFSFNASPAAIFRTLAKKQVTLLFDEVDAVFQQRGQGDSNEELRALLNAGYKRGAEIQRCVGPRHDVQPFPVFAPVALAGLNDLPDTIMSRSIIVRMRRRLDSEHVEPWRSRIHEPEAESLRERLAAWVARVGERAGDAFPELPDGIEDRPAELWEPLLSLADEAGGHWPETARGAAVQMVEVAESREASLGMRLLQDLRAVWKDDEEALETAVILERLHALDESPWADLYRGKGLNARGLAKLLGRYELRSRQVHPANKKGYSRADLEDAWDRYLSADPHTPKRENVTNVNSSSTVQEDNNLRSDRDAASERAEREANVGPSARSRKKGRLPFDDGGGDAPGEEVS